jgi:hypothetical protein
VTLQQEQVSGRVTPEARAKAEAAREATLRLQMEQERDQALSLLAEARAELARLRALLGVRVP